MEAVVVIVSCILSMMLSALVGKRFAEELADPIKGMGIVISLAGLISTIVSFIGMFTWITPTAISSAGQFEQFIDNFAYTLLAFVLNWLQDSLISILLGMITYMITYITTYLASQFEESYYYFSVF